MPGLTMNPVNGAESAGELRFGVSVDVGVVTCGRRLRAGKALTREWKGVGVSVPRAYARGYSLRRPSGAGE